MALQGQALKINPPLKWLNVGVKNNVHKSIVSNYTGVKMTGAKICSVGQSFLQKLSHLTILQCKE